MELKEFNKLPLLFSPILKGHLRAVGCGAGLVFFLSLKDHSVKSFFLSSVMSEESELPGPKDLVKVMPTAGIDSNPSNVIFNHKHDSASLSHVINEHYYT